MNESIFYFFNNLALKGEVLDTLIIFIAIWLIWWIITGVIVLFLLKKISLKSVINIFIVTLIAWGISKTIKHFYFSPRPFVELSNTKTLLTHGLNDSFPSSHTTFSFALATVVSIFTNYKIGILFFVSALLIGLSRIIVGIHWPLDILGGIIIGTTIPTIFYFIKMKGSKLTKLIYPKKNNPK